MSRQIIATTEAPAAIGPYSQAVRAGDTVYFSGQIPLDPATGNVVEGDITAQTRRVFDNLVAVAQAAAARWRSSCAWASTSPICRTSPR